MKSGDGSSDGSDPAVALGKARAQDGRLRGTFEADGSDEETKAAASHEWLLDLTSDRSARVRSHAVMSICELVEKGDCPAEALEALIPLLGDRSPTVRRSASYTVAILADRDQVDPRALSPLAALLGDKDRAIRSNASRALQAYAEKGYANNEGFEMLANLLTDRYALIRRNAARAMAGYALLGYGNERVYESLLVLIRDRDPSVRQAATTAVCDHARMGRVGPEGLAALVRGSRDRDQEVRFQAVLGIVLHSLAKSFSEEAMEILLRDLDSEGMVMVDGSCYRIRRLASLSISEYASVDLGHDKVLPRIAAYLEDPDEHIRYFLARAHLDYAKAGWLSVSLPRGILIMLGDLDCDNQEIATEVVVEHARKGYCDPNAIEPLLKLLEGDDLDLSLAAGKALAYFGSERWLDEKVLRHAMDFLGDEVAAVREMGAFMAGCYAMGGMCKRCVLDLLDIRLEDSDESVRGFTCGAIFMYAEKGHFSVSALRSLIMNLGPTRWWADPFVVRTILLYASNGYFDKMALDRLAYHAEEGMAETRLDCCTAILEYAAAGRHSSRAFESLISLLQDRSPKLRREAARSIGVYAQNGYRSDEALRRLLPLLEAKDTITRTQAAVTVGDLAKNACFDPTALPRLAGCLGAKDMLLVYHSLTAIEAYADNGIWDRAAWMPLLKLSNNPEFGSWALSVLSKCGFDPSFGKGAGGMGG